MPPSRGKDEPGRSVMRRGITSGSTCAYVDRTTLWARVCGESLRSSAAMSWSTRLSEWTGCAERRSRCVRTAPRRRSLLAINHGHLVLCNDCEGCPGASNWVRNRMSDVLRSSGSSISPRDPGRLAINDDVPCRRALESGASLGRLAGNSVTPCSRYAECADVR
jgi:hypothetical protein